jgi:hypothetical protein
MNAGMSLLASFNAWVKGRPATPIFWTRLGPVSILLDIPFIKFGKFLWDEIWPESATKLASTLGPNCPPQNRPMMAT